MEKIDGARKQAEQAQMAQMEAQNKESQARTELAMARSVADKSLGMERLSRISENQALAVERTAAAARDEDAATLDMIKAIKEIEGMDFEHIDKLVQMLNIVKGQEAAAQQKVSEGVAPQVQAMQSGEEQQQSSPNQ
jgi:hypothetical protein